MDIQIYITYIFIYTQFLLFVCDLVFLERTPSLQDQSQYRPCQFEEERGAGFPIVQLEQLGVSTQTSQQS